MSEDDKTHLSGQREGVSKPAGPVQIVPGTVLKGTYRIDAELGSGGMGTVFRATHLGLDKTMAVKVLSPRAVATPDSLARFEREAKVAGKVSHPAMTAVIDFGVEQGTPYIVMEYVNGEELAELIERSGPMSPRRTVAVMRQIVSLLRAAHALGIVHRDLKPANIKIIQETPEDSHVFVKVLDFGVAKIVGDISGQLTSEGMLVGTPAYMAPEQINGKPIDGRTDLYAAGLMFYEMLSGVRAFKGETIARILHAQMSEPPPPLTVPVPDIVRQTLQKFCEKRPEDRFQDAAEADRALMACEDVLRPPSVNVATNTVLPAATEPENAPDNGVRTIAYRPKKAEPAPVPASDPAPVAAEPKPSSGISVSDSLVREGRQTQEKPALVTEPAPIGPPPKPVPAPEPPPLQTVQPGRSSGAGPVVVVLGVALLLVVAGIAGGVWAWKSGRLAGLPFVPSPGGKTPAGTDPGAVATRAPSNPPPPTEPPQAQGPAPTGTEKATDTPAAVEPEKTPGNEQTAQGQEGSQAGDQPEAVENTPPPQEEVHRARCFVSVVALESNRQGNGQFGPWLPKSVNSRTEVDCDSVAAREIKREYQDLFKKWPESHSEKVLQTQTLSFEPQKKGAPNTRRVVVKVHTKVSESSP
ncbi:MAG: serine/threonine protein kinase [Hyalangium sp.]|uniref:serine/threonine protein kinase n=1 Tax=Hyalangium sp. TaxID=2028555 RepID=UPI003899D6B7